jgi:hypothetical protein
VTRTVLTVAAVLTLVGCAESAVSWPTPQPPPPPAQVAGPVAEPVAVTIPALDVTSTLTDLGLDVDGAMEVPPVDEPQQAGWYQLGVRPGQPGPAVVAGHVSGRPDGADRSVPGVFADLHELAPGDEVLIDRADGSTVVFEVTAVETHDKDAFPTEAVYGDVAVPVLRVITCGGELTDGSYRSNVIAFAVQVGVR